MIVAGFGFRGAATVDSLRSALERAAQGQVPDCLAAPDDKCTAESLQQLSRQLGVSICPVTADDLIAQATLTRSAPSQAARKTGSVCEAAALAAAGPEAVLCGPRAVSEDRLATCCLAMGKEK